MFFRPFSRVFRSARRWFVAISLVLLATGFLYIANCVFGYSYYYSLNKKVELIKNLKEISKDGFDKNPELAELYKKTSTRDF